MDISEELQKSWLDVEALIVARNKLWNEAWELSGSQCLKPIIDVNKPFYPNEAKELFTRLKKNHFLLKAGLEKIIADEVLQTVKDPEKSKEFIAHFLDISTVARKNIYNKVGISYWEFLKSELWIHRQLFACEIPKAAIYNEMMNEFNHLCQNKEENADKLTELIIELTELGEVIPEDLKQFEADYSLLIGSDEYDKLKKEGVNILPGGNAFLIKVKSIE